MNETGLGPRKVSLRLGSFPASTSRGRSQFIFGDGVSVTLRQGTTEARFWKEAMRGGNNLRRAAILLASLPRDDAAALIERLTPDQLDQLSWATANLGTIGRGEQEELVSILAQSFSLTLPVSRGTENDAGGVDYELAAASREISAAEPDVLVLALRGELPQAIVVCLCELPAELAARVLARLPSDLQLEVVQRTAHFEPPAAAVVSTVCHALAEKVGRLSHRAGRVRGGAALVADILSRVDRATERALLENLAEEDRVLMNRILQFMFLFRDLEKVAVAPRALLPVN